MNNQLPNSTNSEDEKIARKLGQVAEQTHANAQFAAELEENLRTTRLRKTSRFAAAFQHVSPALRWAFLMILLAVALSWSIKTLIPSPQPATDNTPISSVTATLTPGLNTPPDASATPMVETGGYDWRRTKLYLSVPLPQ